MKLTFIAGSLKVTVKVNVESTLKMKHNLHQFILLSLFLLELPTRPIDSCRPLLEPHLHNPTGKYL